MKKGKADQPCQKGLVVSKGSKQTISDVWLCIAYIIYSGKVSASKKSCLVFRNPLGPIPNLTTSQSSLSARKPISIVIPFDHLRKKGAMIQKVNVSHDKKIVGHAKERAIIVPSVFVVV
jgi:hypothetical protein